jgi:hypothetical protein
MHSIVALHEKMKKRVGRKRAQNSSLLWVLVFSIWIHINTPHVAAIAALCEI